MPRYCGARTRAGGFCRRRALTGKLRCQMHGGVVGRRSVEGQAACTAGMVAGRARWVARMNALKAQGAIARFPNGRRSKGAPPRSKDKTVARAQRIVDNLLMAKTAPARAASYARPTRPLSKADKLSAATDLALDIVQRILELGVDPNDVRLLAVVKDVALNVIGQAIRVGESGLRLQPPAVGGYDQMFEQLGPAERPLADILAEVEAETE